MTSNDDNTFRSTKIVNDMQSLGAGESMTFHFGSGTDTATDRYMGLSSGFAHGIEVLPTVACSISHINDVALKAAISIGTGGYRSNNVKIESLKIVAGSATVVEVSGKGGL